MEKLKQLFATGALLAFSFVAISATAFAAVPELPSPFGDSGSVPVLDSAFGDTTDGTPALEKAKDTSLPKLEVADKKTTPTPDPDPVKPKPTPPLSPPPTSNPTPTPTPVKIVKTGPELAYLLVPSLALGYIYSRRKKQN